MSRTTLQFRRYYDQYFGKVYRFTLSKVTEDAVAQDITHNIFVKILEQFSDKNKRTEAYLFATARNAIIDYYRALSREKAIKFVLEKEIENTQSVQSIEEPTQVDAIKNAIDRLPKQRQQIVKLKQFQGLTTQEIADKLAISKRTVENQFYRAMQSLRRQFQ